MATRERPRHLVFGAFRIDRKDGRLWRGATEIRLGRKAFGVLCELADRRGELVTKDELLSAVWPETAVSEAVLTTAVREIRRALGDRARRPRFVETVHGRGYRFIAAVERGPDSETAPVVSVPLPLLVGREAERQRLRDAFAAARGGERRLVLVAGEAGIGKTALVDAFLSEVSGDAAIARGQCIEAYGAGEPYLPLLDALARLGREGHAATLALLLAENAPSWLPHLPSIAVRPYAGAQPTAVQMLRELADAIDVLARDRPFVLVLEDLHWCDAATLGWIDAVARRRDTARLLLVATYRPVQTIVHGGPLRRLLGELRRLPAVSELVLDYLSFDPVATYAQTRLPRASEELARVLHERSHGHPLFLVTLVEDLRRARTAAATAGAPDPAEVAAMVPASVRQHIEQQLDGLAPDERRILEAASVAGPAFAIAAVAAAIDVPERPVEDACTTWARDGRFVREEGAARWPDGTLTTTFRFRHDLWPEVVRQTIPAGYRARLHREIALRIERAYGERAAEAAAELAVHFEEGREPERAVRYRRAAAANAVRRSAYAEALDHIERGLSMLPGLEPGAARDAEALALSLDLGALRAASEGWATEALDGVYARARALARKLGDRERELRAIWGQLAVAIVRADYAAARRQSDELGELATHVGDRPFRMGAHFERGGTELLLGALTPAREAFDEALALYEPADHAAHVARFGMDLDVFARAWSAHHLWLVGETAAAVARSEEAIERAEALGHPFSRAIALAYAAMLARLTRDASRTRALAAATAAICERFGFPYYAAWARIFGGSVAGATGIVEIRTGIAILEASGGQRSRAYHETLLAEALLADGDDRDASRALETAFESLGRTGERWCESELFRVEGEILAARGEGRAEASFRRALEVATRQGAVALALRAALALARSSESGHPALAAVLRDAPVGLGGPDFEEARSRLGEPPT